MQLGDRTTRQGLLVFGSLLLCSLLFFSGRLDSSDELLMGAMSHAIATRFGLTHAEIHGKTFSSYGVGTPLLAVPFAWIEAGLRAAGVRVAVSLLPLANSLLFALAGWFAFGTAARLRSADDAATVARSVVLLMLASPLLAASTTFCSEPLAAASMAGLLWAATAHDAQRRSRAVIAMAFLCGTFCVLARVAMAPFAGMLLLWAWTNRGARRPIVAGAVGAACGFVVWMGVNVALRGGPFASGYETSDFTASLLTGLHGMLMSPERGILVFFPAILLLFVPRSADARWAELRRLAVALLLFALVFHAKFWTWHGGWTAGPRFLLPFIAVAVPVLAVVLPERLRSGGLAGLALAWGLYVSAVYAACSPMDVWNELWGFHQIESRWLFEPQMGLLAHWPWSEARTALGGAQALAATAALAVAAAVSFRGARPAGADVNAGRLALVLGGAALLAAIAAGSGPRGFRIEEGGDATGKTLPRLRLSGDGAPWRLSGILDLRLPGRYTFHAKVQGECRVYLDGQPFFEFAENTPRQLRTWTLDVAEAGERLMEVEFQPHPDQPGMLNVYWTWPGEGRLMEPVGGEYVLPSEPGPMRRALLRIGRRSEILLAGVMALVLLWGSHGRKSPALEPSGS